MKHKKGQVLLITAMILATVMTIVLSISFKSVTETQVTELEEESQKALAAAESAIEVALKENQNVTIGSGSLNSITGFSGNAVIETVTSNIFMTPTLPKDGSYTFYLGDYDIDSKTVGPSIAEDISVCYQSGSINPALEITLVKESDVIKYVIDGDSRITNAITPSSICSANSSFNYSYTIASADISINGKVLIVRPLYASTKLLFSRGSNLPVQGRTITSEAVSSTSTDVSKKVTLFQSYPQIPGEFFTTSF